MEKVVSEISSDVVVKNPYTEQTMQYFLSNGNTGPKWQRGCMVNININLCGTSYCFQLKRNGKSQRGV